MATYSKSRPYLVIIGCLGSLRSAGVIGIWAQTGSSVTLREIVVLGSGTTRAGLAAWLMTFVVPPAVAGELGQRFVIRHPGWAVAIGVAYVALVAVGGFFAVVVRDVSSRWQTRLVDRIDLFLQRKAARFGRRYRAFVLGSLRFMDHKGLATVGPFTPELDAVFVNVSLTSRPPQQIETGVLPGLAGEQARRRVLDDLLGREEPAILAVLGSPGSGKTTLLRHAARQACLRKPTRGNRKDHPRDIPILLYLRDHADAVTANPAVSLAALARMTLGAVAREEPPGWFEQQLREGRCLVLLDGLDEVARQEDRAQVSAWAEAQVRQYPGNDFVISSRPQGYRSAPVEGATIVQVCGFNASQAGAFVHGWYPAVERHSTGSTGPEVAELAVRGAEDLLQRLERAPALYDLTASPLLLTMIANVHRYRGALPGSRADLYAEICQVMLSRRQNAKNLAQPISGDKKEAVLRGLAYTMMKGRVSDLSRTDIFTAIQPALQRISHSVTPDGFIADATSNGLLIERETGQYAFVHQTFQEYLAAAYIRDNGLARDLAVSASDDWWAETVLLYAAISNADPIVRACLEDGSSQALALALDCTEQDSDIDPELRTRVNDLVIAAAAPDADRESRRLFAAILLTRHMRQRERTIAGSQVCLRPIPAEIYRLFLADTQTPEPDAPQAESGTVVGMRGNDAAAFTHWVNMITGGRHTYRLPFAAELNELVLRHHIPALLDGRSPCPWVQAGAAAPESVPSIWFPPATPAPYEIDNAVVADACRLDAELAVSIFMLNGLMLRSRFQCRILAPGPGPGLAHGLTRALARDVDMASELHIARDLDLTRELGVSRALELTYGLSRALARDLGLVRNLEMARHFAVDLASTLNGARDRFRTRDLRSALDRALGLAVTIDKLIGHSSSSTAHGLSQPTLDITCHHLLGRAFSDAITPILRSSQQEGWTARFITAFIAATGVGSTGHVTADPAAMDATLRHAANELADVINQKLAELPEAASWRLAMVEHQEQTTRAVFARAQPLTLELAAALRMAALCLASEADGMEREDIGHQYRQLAAGITLLQRRAAGNLPAAEVIMLAVA
jgi:hypothetical protein